MAHANPRTAVIAIGLLSLAGLAGEDRSVEPPTGSLWRRSDPWACPTPVPAAEGAACKPSATEREAFASLCAARAGGGETPPVTLAGLLAGMVDLGELARLPDPPYTSHLVSSFDRRSTKAKPGERDWYANHDYLHLRGAGRKTLLHVRHPGVITRIWSASPAGTLSVFLDGSKRPVVEAPFEALMRGERTPLLAPFAFTAPGGGYNLYFPIPFARSARVTLRGPAARTYYHIAYRRYPEGTRVESFGARSLADSACTRAMVAERLDELRAGTGAVDDAPTVRRRLRAGEGAVEIGAARGGSALRELRLWADDVAASALRPLVLSIAFDGVETVRAPVGDFFGSGAFRHRVRALPVGAVRTGPLTARWPMPFRQKARIALESATGEAREVLLSVTAAAEPWTDRSLYFHAGWKAPETFPSKPRRDWNLATLAGPGVYVGNVLNVVNRNRAWWGEGDEKIYVDGEPFPSHFGTGTEDYYGYAWCSNRTFSRAYVGQPQSTRRVSFGYASMYRFHVPDPIPFSRSLRFDLEVRKWGEPVPITYDAMSVWYAKARRPMADAARDLARFRIPELNAEPERGTPRGRYVCGPP